VGPIVPKQQNPTIAAAGEAGGTDKTQGFMVTIKKAL
jgi:hypothetical protein